MSSSQSTSLQYVPLSQYNQHIQQKSTHSIQQSNYYMHQNDNIISQPNQSIMPHSNYSSMPQPNHSSMPQLSHSMPQYNYPIPPQGYLMQHNQYTYNMQTSMSQHMPMGFLNQGTNSNADDKSNRKCLYCKTINYPVASRQSLCPKKKKIN
ncbi:hypothetical protein [Parasitella parasitica]|uniref:Uncharacterized protein n=1 Tax=Parasitella parasitica TaxID=35722 RepID=A0A0B7N1T8_9FUNG|nr:hypothetical protein [Parasitella parasitica]